MKKNRTKLSVYVDDTDLEMVDKYAVDNFMSKSAVVCELIHKFIKQLKKGKK